MKLLFVYYIAEDAGSAQDIASYARVAAEPHAAETGGRFGRLLSIGPDAVARQCGAGVVLEDRPVPVRVQHDRVARSGVRVHEARDRPILVAQPPRAV